MEILTDDKRGKQMIDLSKTTISKAELLETLPDEVLDSWCMYTTYTHQYALGICGFHRHAEAYIMNETMGFPYQAAAYKAAKDAGVKRRTIIGEKTPYGNLGYLNKTRTAMTIRQFLESNLDLWHSPSGFTVLPDKVKW